MTNREREALDRHITGNYGEDQFKGMDEEPQEEDLVTNDYVTFWRHGMNDRNPVFIVPIDAEGFESGKTWQQCVREYMEWQEDSGNQYWPNVWFISDHGNSVLLSLEEK